MDVKQFWADVLAQNANVIGEYFVPDAYVNWHNTNEHFTVAEFIRANCEYPGDWTGDVERVFEGDNLVITATHVYQRDGKPSFHVTSFIQLRGDKIVALDEYWGDDGEPPSWRQKMRIGTKI